MAHYKPDNFVKYKFKSLKTYTSTEWLADSKKKYRQVFDRGETSYIFAEFSFFNKLFDEEDWEAHVSLKAFKIASENNNPRAAAQETCHIELDKPIAKDLNIVYIREGWGMDKRGEFWKEGNYYWEAYIDNEKIATSNFYIYDVGQVNAEENPYLSVASARLYEGARKDSKIQEHTYYNMFSAADTRFIWVEFKAKNKLNKAWKAEIIFNFYNDARQLKGQTIELVNVVSGQDIIMATSGWGSDHKGTWFTDNYTVEIVFMDTLIGIVPFKVGDHFIEGETLILHPDESGANLVGVPNPTEEDERSLEELLSELDSMVGLTEIKARLREYAQYLNFLNIRKEKGFEDKNPTNLHVVFTGNPGTGKTTLARMLGKIYYKLGLLNRGHIHEVDRADIIGEYIGQTAPKMRAAIEKARGGVLFIDEAYALVRSSEDKRDYGREAIEILVKELTAPKMDFAVIMAGYPKEMELFLKTNPGLKSRLNLQFDFPDFTPTELMHIGQLGAEKSQVTLDMKAEVYLLKKLTEAYRNRDRSFGNARYALSLINEAKMNLGLRIMKAEDPSEMSKEDLSLIRTEDFEEIFKPRSRKRPELPVDDELLTEGMKELNGLIGLEQAKAEVNDLIKLVRFYKEIDKNVLHRFSLHSVFTGNPGTGKTTVARIIGKIYRALGLLERGHVMEADRPSLIGKFIGETADKTSKIIEASKGGVLFIDEAYTLAKGSQNDYGQEAIDTLLKRMEDLRGELVVIVAGYPRPMRNFLESNPGLKSRFDRKFTFPDYSPEELLSIAKVMLHEEHIELTPEASEHLGKYFFYLHRFKNKYFGNARAVRKVVEKAINNQHLRLASLSPDLRTDDMLTELHLMDVAEFKQGNDQLLEDGRQGRVGFI